MQNWQTLSQVFDLAICFLRFLLENYPSRTQCPGVWGPGVGAGSNPCDFTRWRRCQCNSPAVFTDDGRGNCNLGSTKADR